MDDRTVDRYLRFAARADPARNDSAAERETAARKRRELVVALPLAEQRALLTALRQRAAPPAGGTADPIALAAITALREDVPALAREAVQNPDPLGTLFRTFVDVFGTKPPRSGPVRASPNPPGAAPPPPAGRGDPFGASGAEEPFDPFAESALGRRKRAPRPAAGPTSPPPPSPSKPPPSASKPPPSAAKPPPPAAEPSPPPPSPSAAPPPAPDAAVEQHRRRAILQHFIAACERGSLTSFDWSGAVGVVERRVVAFADLAEGDVVLRPGDPVTPQRTWARVAILLDRPREALDRERPLDLLRQVAALAQHATDGCTLYRLTPPSTVS